MTLAAVQPAVRPFEHVAGLAVIEFGQVHIPADWNEVRPIVLGVATRAFALAPGLELGRVKTALSLKPLPDFRMTAQAPEISIHCLETVAIGALGGAIERAVSLGEFTGRELSPAGGHHQSRQQQGPEWKEHPHAQCPNSCLSCMRHDLMSFFPG